MSVTELKKRIREAIDTIEDEAFLEAMLTIADSQKKNYYVDKEVLQILKEREERYLAGKSKTISLEEFKVRMKDKHGL